MKTNQFPFYYYFSNNELHTYLHDTLLIICRKHVIVNCLCFVQLCHNASVLEALRENVLYQFPIHIGVCFHAVVFTKALKPLSKTDYFLKKNRYLKPVSSKCYQLMILFNTY